MRPTNYLLLTVLTILIAIYGFQQIGKSINQRMFRTAEKIESVR